MLETLTNVALGVLLISVALCLYRVFLGPSVPDRVVALDTVAAIVMMAIAILAFKFQVKDYLDAVLVIGVVSFVGTVSLSKYLGRGRVIDRDSD